MLLYSVSVKIDRDIQVEWQQWMQAQHIPDVLATGLFVDAVIYAQTEPDGERDRCCFRIDYRCISAQQLERYQRDYAPALQADHSQRYTGRFSASRQILQQL